MIKRLQQIAVEKTLNIQVKCVLNETVVDKNFSVIIQCLKDLDNYRENSDKQIKIVEDKNNKFEKQLANLKDIVNRLRQNKQKSGGDNNNDKKQNLSQQYDSNILDQLRRKIKEESQKNHKNNLENLKDINILMSDIKDLKQQIANLKNQSQNAQRPSEEDFKTIQKQDLQNIRIVQNQMQKQLEDTRKLQQQIQKLKNKDQSLQDLINKLLNGGNNNSNNNNLNDNSNKNELNDLKDRLKSIQKTVMRQDISQQKMNNIINKIFDDKLKDLYDWRKQIQQRLSDLQENLNQLNNNTKIEKLELSKKNSRKDSIQTDRNKNDLQLTELDNRMQKLQNRVDELEILLKDLQKGFNTKIDEKKQQKFPNINTNRNLKNKILREKDIISREIITNKANSNDFDKKLLDLKVQLQQWIKQLLENRNNNGNKNQDESIRELELKIQEIKMNLEKKADQQGVKKYLTFLENKINQIFVFLSQPDSQDALIARKGWNCLSCTKKLEKYKGRLGEHLNWNNLTTANYSPPRVGFTQTYKSSQRTKFVSMAGEKKPFGYQEQFEKNES